MFANELQNFFRGRASWN
jgi:hypothetical protein